MMAVRTLIHLLSVYTVLAQQERGLLNRRSHFRALQSKDGWTCESDGYWYDTNGKSVYQCGDSLDKDSSSGDKDSSSGDKDSSSGEKDTSSGGDKSGYTGESKDEGNYGWTCQNNVWVDQEGAATAYPCAEGDSLKDPEYGDKDGMGGCTVTGGTMATSVFADVPRTCIDHPSYVQGRCWWTYVPAAVDSGTARVPLIIDMHGGGGCASDQYLTSGLKDRTDVIVAYPQGGEGGIWASTGTSTRATQLSGKSVATWDDVGFLEQLIANMVGNSSYANKIDAGRVYLTGFSLGCMMAHRMALERSHLIAAFGCHGGELSLFPTTTVEMDADKQLYNLLPMPAYISIGENDAWRPGAVSSYNAWKYWNECSSESTTSVATGRDETRASSCTTYTPALQTVQLDIAGGAHAPDMDAYSRAYEFMSQFSRSGVQAQLGTAVGELNPSAAAPQTPTSAPTSAPTPVAAADPTVAPTTSTATQATTASSQATMTMTISNVNYAQLTASGNSAVRQEFEDGIKNAVAEKVTGISAADVQVILSSGSVIAAVTVTAPANVAVADVVSDLQAAERSSSLQAKVLENIQAVVNIADVSTAGADIGVVVQTSAAPAESSTSRAANTSSSSSLHIGKKNACLVAVFFLSFFFELHP